MNLNKTELENAIITLGQVLEQEDESLDNFDLKIIQDLSTLLSFEVQKRLDRAVH
jgi:hypothetical protein